ncbi:MAG: hypothetical protein QOD77_1153 [Thermoplasmata archaeon]|jgi:uncharacterized membrane protein YsdA (DUF1294 family)|nr:hypothetical protein [Thermoplasmata archaeon]
MEPCGWLWAWLGVANLAGLVLVAADKRAAKRRARRRSEAALLLWAALGGWAGMLLGMLLVRHKTRKPAFLVPFGLAAVAAVAWAWFAWRAAC